MVIITLDKILTMKNININELSKKVKIEVDKLELLKSGKAKGIKFSTLNVLCRELRCNVSDLIKYIE